MWAALPVSGAPTAYGTVPCGHRHTYIQVTLNIRNPNGTSAAQKQTATTPGLNPGWVGPSTNSYGMSGWYQVQAAPAISCGHGDLYQAVVQAQVDNTVSYATTGTPKALC